MGMMKRANVVANAFRRHALHTCEREAGFKGGTSGMRVGKGRKEGRKGEREEGREGGREGGRGGCSGVGRTHMIDLTKMRLV